MPDPLVYGDCDLARRVLLGSAADPVHLCMFGDSITERGNFTEVIMRWPIAKIGGGFTLADFRPTDYPGIDGNAEVSRGGGNDWCPFSYGTVLTSSGATTPSDADEQPNWLRLSSPQIFQRPEISGGKQMYATFNRGDWTARRFAVPGSIFVRVLVHRHPGGEPAAAFRPWYRAFDSSNFVYGDAFSSYAATPEYVLYSVEVPAGVNSSLAPTGIGGEYGVRLAPSVVTTDNATTRICGIFLDTGESDAVRFATASLSGSSPASFISTANYADTAFSQGLTTAGISDVMIMLGANVDVNFSPNLISMIARLRLGNPDRGIILVSPYDCAGIDSGVTAGYMLDVAQATDRCLFLDLNQVMGVLASNYQGLASESNAVLGDGVHPHSKGRQVLGHSIHSLLARAAASSPSSTRVITHA